MNVSKNVCVSDTLHVVKMLKFNILTYYNSDSFCLHYDILNLITAATSLDVCNSLQKYAVSILCNRYKYESLIIKSLFITILYL